MRKTPIPPRSPGPRPTSCRRTSNPERRWRQFPPANAPVTATLFAVIAALLTFHSSASATTPSTDSGSSAEVQADLVVDLYRGVSPLGSNPFPTNWPSRDSGGSPRDQFFFWAQDDAYGTELWTTDGTEAGPRRLTDICPGSCDSIAAFSDEIATPDWPDRPLLVVADDGASGPQLWRVERTGGDARRLTTLPGFVTGVAPTIILSSVVLDDGRILFAVQSGGSSSGAWSTDGTPEGTLPLWDRQQVGELTMRAFYDLGDHIVFDAYTPEVGTEWYRTDGNGSLPELILDACPGECPVSTATSTQVGDRVVFRFFDTVSANRGWRTWSTGGTAATTISLDSACGTDCGFVGLHALGDIGYFFNANQLWQTDATVAGTRPVVDLPVGARLTGVPPVQIAGTPHLLLYDDAFVASLYRLNHPIITAPTSLETLAVLGPGQFEMVSNGNRLMVLSTLSNRLWLSDGTSAGTTLSELPGTPPPNRGWPRFAVATQDRFFFSAAADEAGRELWTSDGTPAGTRRAHDLRGDPAGSQPADFAYLTGDGSGKPSGILFTTAAGDAAGMVSPVDGRDLWFLPSGSADPVRVFAAIDHQLPFSPGVENPQATSRGMLFDVWTVEQGSEPWFSDGTVAGTVALGDLNPMDANSHARETIELDGRIYFVAEQGQGEKIWTTDGTPEGTRVLVDIDPTWTNDFYGCGVCSPPVPPGPIFPHSLTVLGDQLLFGAFTPEHGAELWTTDGTEAGTRQVVDLAPGPGWSDPISLERVGDYVVFVAESSSGATQVWSTDGSASGTRLVAELSDAPFHRPAGSEDPPFRIVGGGSGQRGRFALIRTQFRGPTRLWLGRLAGGNLDGALTEIPISGPIQDAVASATRLFLATGDTAEGTELWTSNATFDGLERLSVRGGPLGSGPSELTLVPGALVFVADDGAAGSELWRLDLAADGSPSGQPYLWTDIRPGAASSSPKELRAALDASPAQLYFSAFDTDSGREPWSAQISPGDPPPLPCESDDTTICIGDRFRLRAFFRASPWRPGEDRRRRSSVEPVHIRTNRLLPLLRR